MATDQPLLSRQRVFGCKVEVTTGTAESITAAEGAYNVFDADLSPEVTMHARPGQSNLSPRTAVAGMRAGRYRFRTELVGSGTSGLAPTWAGTLLLACGFENSSGTTYVPNTDGATTLTMAAYEDGRSRLLVGSMGTCVLTFRAGAPVDMAWEFLGKLGVHGDSTIIAPTYPTTLPPRFGGATLTVGGTAFKIAEMTISLGSELILRENQADATGIHAAYIVGRDVRVTMDPEAVLHATRDWHAAWLAGTEYALSCAVGTASGNTVTITAPKMQIHEYPVGDRNGILVDQLTFACNRSVALGDDEISIVFS